MLVVHFDKLTDPPAPLCNKEFILSAEKGSGLSPQLLQDNPGLPGGYGLAG